LVNLETTGHGTVRFNPNLYSCGKVCLSLLGTWSGTQSEQWNETTSTILQVLISIQSLILIDNPYFNEPGNESKMHTPAGIKASKSYNHNIRVECVRWAMIDQLRNPSSGFEDIIRTHFKLKRQLVLDEVNEWVKDSIPTNQVDQMKELYKALQKELEKLD